MLALDVPDGSRLEYKLEVADSWGQHLVEDPLNPNVAHATRSAPTRCARRGATSALWVRHADDVPPGTFRELVAVERGLRPDRHTTVYVPAAGLDDGGPAPLVVVHDGGDYLRYAGARTVLDNLVHGAVIPPAYAAFVQPGERLVEYADDPRHVELLTDELVPRLEAELPAARHAGGRCLDGGQLRRRRLPVGRVRGRRAPSGGCCCSRDRSPVPATGCRRRAEPLWRPVRPIRPGVPGRARAASPSGCSSAAAPSSR